MESSSLYANPEAERSILGAILLDNLAYTEGAKYRLQVKDFALDSHRRIYARMVDLAESARPIDMITLIEELDRHKDLQAIGDVGYVSSLLDGVPDRPSIEHYVKIVRDKALSRNLIRVGEKIERLLGRGGFADEVLAAIEMEISGLVRENELSAASNRIQTWEQIPTLDELSIPEVSWIVEGMIPDRSIVLWAGESGSYKTWLSLWLAKAIQEGREFLGRKTIQRPVLYLDRENPLTVIKERCSLLGIISSQNLRFWGSWEGAPPPIIGDRRLLKIASKIQPLIIVDSFIRFHKGDENSAAEMAPIMAELRKLAHAGATVVLQHHKGKAECTHYRGSSDIKAGVDLCFAVNHDRERNVISIECFKNRFGQETTLAVKPQIGNDDAFDVMQDEALLLEREIEQRLIGLIEREPGLSQSELLKLAGLPLHKGRRALQRGLRRLWRTEQGLHGRLSYYTIGPESTFSVFQSSSSEKLKSSSDQLQTIEGQL